jgi:hypothetical protein
MGSFGKLASPSKIDGGPTGLQAERPACVSGLERVLSGLSRAVAERRKSEDITTGL